MMDKQTLKIAGIVVGALIVLFTVYFFAFVRQVGEYSVVYLSSGELYIGRLSTFPRLTLSDAYLFQAVADPADFTKTTFQLSPLEEALWAPQYLYLNPNHVLFSGPLSESSKALQTLQDPANSVSASSRSTSTSAEE